MSTMALHQTYRETDAIRATISGLKRWRRLILGFAFGFPIFFYLLLLTILVVRYGNLPNYVTLYNWPANVWRIIVSTQSVADMVPIIGDEWLLEIGRMDYEYGHGIADWTMAIIPHKLLILSLTGALIALNIGLIADRQARGSVAQQCIQACRSGLLTSAGALSASVTSATIFSVACCSAPSWVGSLAVLGVETSSAFALEPYGPTASLLGIAALIVSALLIAREGDTPISPAPQPSPQGALSC